MLPKIPFRFKSYLVSHMVALSLFIYALGNAYLLKYFFDNFLELINFLNLAYMYLSLLFNLFLVAVLFILSFDLSISSSHLSGRHFIQVALILSSCGISLMPSIIVILNSWVFQTFRVIGMLDLTLMAFRIWVLIFAGIMLLKKASFIREIYLIIAGFGILNALELIKEIAFSFSFYLTYPSISQLKWLISYLLGDVLLIISFGAVSCFFLKLFRRKIFDEILAPSYVVIAVAIYGFLLLYSGFSIWYRGSLIFSLLEIIQGALIMLFSIYLSKGKIDIRLFSIFTLILMLQLFRPQVMINLSYLQL